MPVSPVTPVAVSRRAMITGALLGLATAGCTITRDSDDAGSEASDGPSASGSPSGLAPDVAVATEALAQVRGMREAVTATTTRFPALAATLMAVSAMHSAHATSLVDAVPADGRSTTGATPYAVPRGRGAALERLAVAERTLHTSLAELALRAESGDFAGLLASMGAGIGQQLARWPR